MSIDGNREGGILQCSVAVSYMSCSVRWNDELREEEGRESNKNCSSTIQLKRYCHVLCSQMMGVENQT
jgi:hypothetical protein